MSDAFDPPENDTIEADRARRTLYLAAASALGLGLLQWCCNPVYLVSIAAGGAAMNAIRQPRWFRISLDEDYPADAGTVSSIAGYIGLILVAMRVLLEVVGMGLILSGQG